MKDIKKSLFLPAIAGLVVGASLFVFGFKTEAATRDPSEIRRGRSSDDIRIEDNFRPRGPEGDRGRRGGELRTSDDDNDIFEDNPLRLRGSGDDNSGRRGGALRPSDDDNGNSLDDNEDLLRLRTRNRNENNEIRLRLGDDDNDVLNGDDEDLLRLRIRDGNNRTELRLRPGVNIEINDEETNRLQAVILEIQNAISRIQEEIRNLMSTSGM